VTTKVYKDIDPSGPGGKRFPAVCCCGGECSCDYSLQARTYSLPACQGDLYLKGDDCPSSSSSSCVVPDVFRWPVPWPTPATEFSAWQSLFEWPGVELREGDYIWAENCTTTSSSGNDEVTVWPDCYCWCRKNAAFLSAWDPPIQSDAGPATPAPLGWWWDQHRFNACLPWPPDFLNFATAASNRIVYLISHTMQVYDADTGEYYLFDGELATEFTIWNKSHRWPLYVHLGLPGETVEVVEIAPRTAHTWKQKIPFVGEITRTAPQIHVEIFEKATAEGLKLGFACDPDWEMDNSRPSSSSGSSSA
jgi:hypothetical protein